jgi:UDP-glucuronate 4-epimerase
MLRVLITGAAGFIGMHTSLKFLKEGWDVIGLDNFNDYYSVKLKNDRIDYIQEQQKTLNTSFEIFNADLNSEVWSILDKLNFDAVVHLAAQAGVRYSLENPRAYLDSNIFGFQRVLEFVERKNISRFAYASSSSVYGKDSIQPFDESQACDQPESYYASTKRSNELMAFSYFKTKGVTSLGLRFFTVYGPWGRPDMAPILFARAAQLKSGIKVFNHGNQKRDFTYVDDITEGIFRLISGKDFIKDAQVVNIGYGAPTALLDFIALIEKEMSVTIQKELVPEQKGDVQVTFASTRKLQGLIDYNPKTPIEKGVELFINWFKSYEF